MASGDDWDAAKMFDMYLHDYMVKKKMHKTAAIFKKEADICDNPVVIDDSPGGFLFEWWSIFFDVYAFRQLEPQYAEAEGSVKATQMTQNEQQKINSTMSQLVMNQHRPGRLIVTTDLDNTFGLPAACLLTAKMYEEERLKHSTGNFDPNLCLLDANKLRLPNSAAISLSHPQQQIREQAQQLVVRENRNVIGMERTVPMDSMLYGIPKMKLPITGPPAAGMHEGINSAPLDGWPLTALNSQQLKMLAPDLKKALLAKVLTRMHRNEISTFPGSPSNFDSPNLMLDKMELSAKDRQVSGNNDFQVPDDWFPYLSKKLEL